MKKSLAAVLALTLTACGAKTGLLVPSLDAQNPSAEDASVFDGGRGIVQIALGNSHTCALRADGTVACWGFNEHGQAGDGTHGNDRPSPVAVVGLTDARAIVAGQHHSCALRADRTIACWGWNESGQLGDLTNIDRSMPVAVAGVHDAIAVAAGFNQGCAVLTDHTVVCWGQDQTSSHSDAQPIAGLDHVAALAIGELFACALRLDHTVSCWGWNGRGQLGDGTSIDHPAPGSRVVGLSDVSQIATGDSYACALGASHAVSCWGWNDHGQLADGTTTMRSSPASSLITGDVAAIATGFGHACALDRSGTLSCWGGNGSGMLGDGTIVEGHVPVTVTGLTEAVGVAAGNVHTCALRRIGTVVCWGHDSNGELGDGTRIDHRTPMPVIGL